MLLAFRHFERVRIKFLSQISNLPFSVLDQVAHGFSKSVCKKTCGGGRNTGFNLLWLCGVMFIQKLSSWRCKVFYKHALIIFPLPVLCCTLVLGNQRVCQEQPRSQVWTGVSRMVVPHMWTQLCLVITTVISCICISLCYLLISFFMPNFCVIHRPIVENRQRKHRLTEENLMLREVT